MQYRIGGVQLQEGWSWCVAHVYGDDLRPGFKRAVVCAYACACAAMEIEYMYVGFGSRIIFFFFCFLFGHFDSDAEIVARIPKWHLQYGL